MYEDVILANEEALSESFLPTNLIHRENVVKEIARCLAPALRNKSINNLFIIGPTGVGKTVVVKWILNEQFDGNSVYINCWNCTTQHKVLAEILHKFGFVVHGRESNEELVKKLERCKKKIIICLDEVDQLKEPQILYTLARREIGLILISNHPIMTFALDSRIKSSLLLNEIEFKQYSHKELYDILKDRVGFAFRPGSISDELLHTIALMSNGDARIGLLTLKAAAKNAEAKGLSQITINEVKQALKGARRLRLSYLLKKLNRDQRIIYEILKSKARMSSGKLYEEYSKVVSRPVVDRAYRKYMRGMVQLGLIKAEGSGRWKVFELVV